MNVIATFTRFEYGMMAFEVGDKIEINGKWYEVLSIKTSKFDGSIKAYVQGVKGDGTVPSNK